jgi:hypothetical protein
MSKLLKIYIDESGNFHSFPQVTDLYLVSLVLFDTEKDISFETEKLNKSLVDLRFNGMIHTADLVSRRDDYDIFEREELRKIFWALFNYLRTVPVYLKTVIANKSFVNDKIQLSCSLKKSLHSFVDINRPYLESFDKIGIYYDRGQKELAVILTEVFPGNKRIIWNSGFDKIKERLFQVADMMTFLDKLVYKINEGLTVTKAENDFFSAKDLKYIMRTLTNKRLQ